MSVLLYIALLVNLPLTEPNSTALRQPVLRNLQGFSRMYRYLNLSLFHP